MLASRLNYIHDDRNLASLMDAVDGRPVDLSDARIMRDREALEDAVFEVLNAEADQGAAHPAATKVRRWLFARALACATALALFAVSPAPASERIEGRATIVDGDTVAIEGTDARIRLYGIDNTRGKFLSKRA